MKTARLHAILLEADGPLIVALRDRLGGVWLGMAVEREANGEQFVCVPVSSERLSAFRHGQIDLRDVLALPETEEHARVRIPVDGTEALAELELELVPFSPPEDWLPDPGFFLTTFVEPVAAAYQSMASLATMENRPILRLNLQPVGGGHAIDIDQLGEALVLFQNGVKQAHVLVTRDLPVTERKMLSSVEHHTFEALAFASNSFEVHMRAKGSADLFGHTPHVRALTKLDEIASVVDDIEAAVGVAKANRGHFVSAITAIMRFVADSKTPLSYAWAVPQSPKVHAHVIKPEAAQALYEALVSKQELARQDVTLVGVFRKIDEESGTWRLESYDGEQYSGTVSSESGVSLHGMIIGARTYRVECRDVLLEMPGSGRQASKLEITALPEEVGSSLPENRP